MSIGAKKPKLSGAARRKLWKKQFAAGKPAALVPRDPFSHVRVGRLQTVDEWRQEISKVYRAMRTGTLRSDEGTKLTYVANVGAQLAKIAQELQELETLRQQLAQVQSGAPLAAQDFLPAASHDDDADQDDTD